VFGEERHARAVARAVIEARRDRPISCTTDLARLVERVMGPRGQDRIHPATRTFQALRIYVNRELDELASGLAAAERLLKAGGRLAVVSFHSLEDRIVKTFLAERSGRAPRASRHAPAIEADAPTFELLFRKPVEPSADEIAVNPRARSARLRAAVRTAAPARPRPGCRRLGPAGAGLIVRGRRP
jgi:16S rRNA (cytosine1402-N4)-methyltransferase